MEVVVVMDNKIDPKSLQHDFTGGPKELHTNNTGRNNYFALYTKAPDIHDPERGMQNVGAMHWHPETGHLLYIEVHPYYRRKGIATAMWSAAKDFVTTHGKDSPVPLQLPKHSDNRTPEGTAWAKSTRDPVPPIASGVCRTCSKLRTDRGGCDCNDTGPPHLFG